MTTSTPPAPRERVQQTTAALIDPLQNGYLADRPQAVARLARLRLGAGRMFAQVPHLWGLIDTSALHANPEPGVRPLGEDDLDRAEKAIHTAVTLWALHQQSRGSGMHRAQFHGHRATLGAGVARMMPEDPDAPVRKRLVRAGTATAFPALADRLRDIVALLRGADIPLDYALLAGQLYRWQTPGGRDAVRREWGRSFHFQGTARPGLTDQNNNRNPNQNNDGSAQ